MNGIVVPAQLGECVYVRLAEDMAHFSELTDFRDLLGRGIQSTSYYKLALSGEASNSRQHRSIEGDDEGVRSEKRQRKVKNPSPCPSKSMSGFPPCSGRAAFFVAAGMTSIALAAYCLVTSGAQAAARKKTVSGVQIYRLIARIESLVQQDEGKRGIKPLLEPAGELLRCCKAISNSSNVVIITGFPCMLDHTPPTETDGPLGALALAKTLLHLGKEVSVLTDECNEEVVLACSAASEVHSFGSKLSLQSFPAKDSMGEKDWAYLEQAAEKADLVIAIERAGPNKEDRYLTMRCRDMTHIISPLDILLTNDRRCRSIGIGDGGNEVGMGKAYDRVVASAIPNASKIACKVAADHLLVASVSNWGGYALCAAAILYDQFLNCPAEEVPEDQLRQALALMLPTEQEELGKCQRMIDAGARDGISGEKALMVDGMPLRVSLDLLDKLRQIV